VAVVDEETARAWVAGGFAEWLDAAPAESAGLEPESQGETMETTMEEPPPENAAVRPRGRGRR
jgi:hypothetical protein